MRQYGCYGCHEINGFDGPTKRIGPDLRLEPNYYDVAAQILQDPGLNDDERELGDDARRIGRTPTKCAHRADALDQADAELPDGEPKRTGCKPRLTPRRTRWPTR